MGFPVGDAPANSAVRIEKTGPFGPPTTWDKVISAANVPSLPWAQFGWHS
jgi:hypothetical protein